MEIRIFCWKPYMPHTQSMTTNTTHTYTHKDTHTATHKITHTEIQTKTHTQKQIHTHTRTQTLSYKTFYKMAWVSQIRYSRGKTEWLVWHAFV